MSEQRCGFIALVGAPNAGKSTLMNALVGSKISIVSPKVQTTRSRVLGIMIEGDSQLVFVDTPGIFGAPKRRLERAMVAAAWAGAGDADIVLVLVDVERGIDADTGRIIEQLKDAGRPLVLALNKIDLVHRERLLGFAAELNARAPFVATFMISAMKGHGVDHLRSDLAARVPAGPWVYPEDQLADMPMRLIAAELTREQLFLQLHDELPYSLMVETDKWEDRKDGTVRIDQTVTIQRDSQKAIVLGAQGRRIRTVGERARKEIGAMLDKTVHLFLHVKVREDWIEDRARYRDMGLDFDS